GASFGSTGVFDAFSAMACSASLLRSISSLNAPHREYSGGISVCLIQLPLANRKKSSPGFTDESLMLASSGGGSCSVCGCVAARKLNTQTSEMMNAMNCFIDFGKAMWLWVVLMRIRPSDCSYVERVLAANAGICCSGALFWPAPCVRGVFCGGANDPP